jgi:hypothetical protein
VAASIQVKRVRCVAMSWGIPSLNSEWRRTLLDHRKYIRGETIFFH